MICYLTVNPDSGELPESFARRVGVRQPRSLLWSDIPPAHLPVLAIDNPSATVCVVCCDEQHLAHLLNASDLRAKRAYILSVTFLQGHHEPSVRIAAAQRIAASGIP
jgi:hypothetical protein